MEVDEAAELEVLNVNGVAVDFAVLETADDLYGAELRRRTAGTETEEEGLGFFRGLEGQWCSRRKKRRIVDASLFGDWLPVGWKLVLALRRRDGRFSVYCRTYMSPSGQQFPSCKDVAYYLLSHYGFSDSNLPIDQGIARVQHTNNMECGSHAGSIHKPGDEKHNTISNSAMPISLLSEAHRKEVSLLDIDNLPEVQVHDTFECHNCNMTFDEKEAYMQHLMSFHQKTTRRFRLGSSVKKGVIIKDGKFECQFCHKEFLERRRYNCHVGIHVRNNVRKSQKMPGQGTVQKSVQQPPTQGAVPSRTSKLDALLQIAENSFLETSSVEHNDKHNGGSSPDQLNNEETFATGFGHELSLGSLPHGKADFMTDKSLDQDLNKHNSECIMPDESSAKIVGNPENGNSKSAVCINDSKHPKLPEVGHTRNSELAIDCGSKHGKISNDIITDPIEQHIKESLLQSRAAEQSLHSNPAFVTIPEREHVCDAQQKIVSVTGPEELRLDEVGPMNGQGFQSLPDVSKDSAINATVQEGFNSFVNLESEAAMLDMSSRHQIATVCVWCRSEFYHEAIDLEALSDSIGFMCPTCKAKISGHLDNGLSMNSNCF